MKAPVGIQLYSLRSVIEDDFYGTLCKVKDAGYDAVEFAGYFGGRTAAQLRQELNSIGLTPLSAHINLDKLEHGLADAGAFYRAVGTPFVACSGSTVEDAARVERSREILVTAAAHFARLGIGFGYHNHWAEFAVRDDQFILETLLRPSARAALNAQFDYCGMQYYDVDPAAYTRRWGDRLNPPHFKDLNANYKELVPGQIDAEVGNGIIDWEAVMAAMRDAGTLQNGVVVEQESFNKDIYESVAISAANIRRLLEKF